LVLKGAEHDSGRHAIRTVRSGSPPAAHPAAVNPELARAMLLEPSTHVMLYVRPRRRLAATARGHAGDEDRWRKQDDGPLKQVADLLEAGSFISAPLLFGRGKGRIYNAVGTRHLNRGDATLLAHIAANELVAIARIDLLDRIASDAAAHERKRIALDLHDTAIQSR
jgi:signal transduction histidine kinase